MNTNISLLSIPSTGTIRDAMGAIDRGAMGLALLTEPGTGRFLGLVTDGDIRRALLGGLGLESRAADVKRPPTQVASITSTAEELAQLFSERVRVIPLLDERGAVVDLAVYDSRTRIPVAQPYLTETELRYVSECILTGWISSAGSYVTRFEELFASFCGSRHAVATSSGTTALHLAMVALGIGPGDEVIVPTLTFIATANAVRYAGATPVFVDSEPLTWNLDPDAVEAAITERTRAIIPVHLYGHPADMAAIMTIAERHGLAVVEDAAEAHGALCRGRRVGSIGGIGVFSFYGNKIVTTGEGGMLTTDNAEIADRVRMLRDHGMSRERRYIHPVLGYNYRLTNLQSAIGVAQMEKIDIVLAGRAEMARQYRQGLEGISGLAIPAVAPWASHAFWLYSILIDESHFGMSRDGLMATLSEAGIDSRPLFPCVHQQPIYNTGEHFPVAEDLSRRGLSLPAPVGGRVEALQRVIEVIRAAHLYSK